MFIDCYFHFGDMGDKSWIVEMVIEHFEISELFEFVQGQKVTTSEFFVYKRNSSNAKVKENNGINFIILIIYNTWNDQMFIFFQGFFIWQKQTENTKCKQRRRNKSNSVVVNALLDYFFNCSIGAVGRAGSGKAGKNGAEV